MVKKYQVFVSSTYEDLKEERKVVIEALLGKSCIPVGMEYFPAANDDQYTVIQKLISKCDYYIVIVGGKYGSIDKKTNKSYTQLEYEYATNVGIPVAAFIREDLGSLPSNLVDDSTALENFRRLIKKRLCSFWKEPYQLAFEVGKSMDYLFENNPREGWVRSSEISSAEANKEILKLQKENRLLLKELSQYRSPLAVSSLSCDEDKVVLSVKNRILDYGEPVRLETTWNKLFSYLSNDLLSSATKKQLHRTIENLIFEKYPNLQSMFIVLDSDYLDQILIQFMALGWIETHVGEEYGSGSSTYYSLTKIGLDKMLNQKALRKSDSPIFI